MKIKIITAIHGRPEVTKAFCVAMSRIKEIFNIDTHAVITPNDPGIKICENYGVRYIEYENNPVGRKLNVISRSMKDYDFTHLMMIGSDDIPSNSFIERQLEESEYDVSGIWDLWFWGLNPKRAGFDTFGYWPGTKGRIGGVGRLISRKVVEDCGWELWGPDRNASLDGSMMAKIKQTSRTRNFNAWSLADNKAFVVDIKYGPQISSLSPTMKTTVFYNPESVLPSFLPENEMGYLLGLAEERKNDR